MPFRTYKNLKFLDPYFKYLLSSSLYIFISILLVQEGRAGEAL